MEWAGEPTKDEKLKAVADASREFDNYFMPRRIYFPRDLSERIQAFHNKLVEIINDFSMGRKREDRNYSAEVDYWGKALATVREESGPVFQELERDFRKMIGIREDEPPATQSRFSAAPTPPA